MAEVTPGAVKSLREKTGAGMMECKRALQEAEGNEEQAIEILRKRGMASASKKAGRVAAEGAVGSYIHMGGKVGVLVEVNCETDFVARTDEFQQLVKDIAMHIAAAEPRYVSREEVPGEVLDKEREITRAQIANDPKNANKPEQVVEKIVEGRLNKFYEESVLLDQPFVKDPAKTINELLTEKIAKPLKMDAVAPTPRPIEITTPRAIPFDLLIVRNAHRRSWRTRALHRARALPVVARRGSRARAGAGRARRHPEDGGRRDHAGAEADSELRRLSQDARARDGDQ